MENTDIDSGPDAAWEVLGTLVRRHNPVLIRVAQSFAGPSVEAEDIVQEALIVAHNSFGELQNTDNPLPWLKKIVRNTGLEVSRKRKRRAEARKKWAAKAGPTQIGERCSIPKELLKIALWRTVEALPELQRTVVLLRVREGMTIAEIAERIDRSPGTVKASLHRARVTLRAELGEDFQLSAGT